MSKFELSNIPLTPEELAEVSASEERGTRIAHRWIKEADERDYLVVDLIVALEVMFAALIVNMDDQICLAESRGGGLISDEDRIDLHIVAIRHQISKIRESKWRGSDDH